MPGFGDLTWNEAMERGHAASSRLSGCMTTSTYRKLQP
jgi:hypothetical protein